ncbi:BTB/POZ domain-containing protein [Durusdinium trenchii]|uniref:BTB/POZ domain-containing protein n=1 Tax=Durusdinium trenchii TaxID=1381693 RepID=A0ABP0NP05_9DINO
MIHRRHLVTFDGRTTVLPTAVSSVALFFTLGFSVAKADLTFKAGEKSLGEAGIQADGYDVFTRDPQGYASHIRLVDGSQIEYFSDEFNELCTQVGATPVSANNPIGAGERRLGRQGCDVAGGSCVQGISQRFQHPQAQIEGITAVREVDAAARAELPEHQYLEDGQLDNPYSGRVSAGNYTEVITTKEFIPDGDLLPVPHTRTQLCHYALRLTQSVSAQNSAAWSRFKQLVAYGFELLRRRKRQRSTRTEFHFRVFHRTKECWIGEWCEPAGADGFAFVVQNEGRKIVGNDISGNGYGFRYSLAVEFDMYRNPDLGELTGNHISVHVPPRKGEPNSADHRLSSIAYTDDIPPLQEGTHVVRIVYDVSSIRWDEYGTDFDSDATGDFLRLQHSGRAGLLSVELDGRRVIVVPVDLANIVNVDGTEKATANTPRQPDPEAYDEKGASPGRAWVGFSSSTSYFQFQPLRCAAHHAGIGDRAGKVSHTTFELAEYAACPLDGVEDSRATIRGQGPEVHCIIRMGTLGRSTCTWDRRQNCSLIIQNAGRSAIKISAHTSHHLPHEYEGCDNGILEWDAMHPWFLGCRRTVRFTHELQELWITSLDGVRALTISDDQILGKSPVLFKRERLFQYCVMEHKYDPFTFYFAECNCEYCMRLLTISNLYNILYQHQCSARYGLYCPCFEASEVQHDTSTWTTLEPLRHMRIHICRGCAYTSHCAKMLKVATCEVSDTGYQLGNPFAPTILENGFQNTSLV